MKIRDKFLLGLLAGILLGAVLGTLAMHMFPEQLCSPIICINKALVVPLSDRGYFPAAHRELQNAKHSIHIIAFEFKYYMEYPNSNQNKLVQDLIDAHDRGVDVRVIVDEYSLEDNAYELLREKGIQIKYDSEDVMTHAKLIIIDGRIVILGSTNFSYYGLEKNKEVGVLVNAEHLADYFERYFEELWEA